MEKKHLVSIIMPAYNAERYIAESIESILQQTYPYWELIIVDDGSVDNTKGVIQYYSAKDKRIQYLWQPNGKQGKARNYGLSYAQGKYIAFLDSDDIWLPKKLEIQLREIAEHQVDLVFSDAYIFESLPLKHNHKMNTVTGYLKGDEALLKMLEINRIPILTVLVKKEAIKKVNGFTEKKEIQNNEDYHLWLKLLINGSVFYGSPEVLSAYRDHSDAVTSGNKLSMKESIETIYSISQTHPGYKQMMYPYLKKWFTRYYYAKNDWDKKAYRELIKKNCIYLNKAAYGKWLYLLYQLTGLKVSRKIIAMTVNA